MKFAPHSLLRSSAFLLCCLPAAPSLVSDQARAAEAGWRPYEVQASATNADTIPVALYYPTQAPAREIAMGPFTVHAAPMAPPEAKVKGLIVISHGTGGSELCHSSLAESLAQDGYLVAALRHPGDNYQDRSLWQRTPGAYFTERPRQASRVIDALLSDPDWKDRIETDAKGPRVGAVGHSAGGYTVVALAGGQSDLSRIGAHCARDGAEDPIFCSMTGKGQPAPAPLALDPVADGRVRAIVAMAPLGVMFTQQSLSAITAPTLIYAAENDRWLPPRFHAAWIAQNVRGVAYRIIPRAWHFAFMDRASVPIPTLDGDANADPTGFDRTALLKQLDEEIPAFFDQALAIAPSVR
jgi:predicted dienelactone hydrolase